MSSVNKIQSLIMLHRLAPWTTTPEPGHLGQDYNKCLTQYEQLGLSLNKEDFCTQFIVGLKH